MKNLKGITGKKRRMAATGRKRRWQQRRAAAVHVENDKEERKSEYEYTYRQQRGVFSIAYHMGYIHTNAYIYNSIALYYIKTVYI